MENEIVKIISIKTDQSIETVKDLKKYIGELRDDLVKLDKNSEEYEETVNALVTSQQKLIEVQNAGKKSYSELDDSIKGLRNQLKALNNTYDELSAADRNSSVGQNILKQIQGVDSQLKQLEEETGRFQRSVGNYERGGKAIEGVFANQRKELTALKTAMDNLDPSSQEYAEAFNRAAEITHNLSERQTMLRYSTTDLGDQISNVVGIGSNMAAGFSAVNAAMGLFGQENEEVQKAMLKVQQAMAIVQGLQGLDGLLKRTQGLSTAMKAWVASSRQVTTATQAQTTATAAETVATEGQTVATGAATVAQKGLNTAMKANPIGVVITAVMALVSIWTIFGKKIKELVQGNERLNAIWTKMKGIVAATATAIKNYFLVPIKETINYVKTLGKVLMDVFTLNWKEIGKDIKEGANNAVDIVKDAGTEIGDAYNDSIEQSNNRAQRRRAAKRAEELNEIIKDKEAQLGSDWKYTQEGIKVYQEYFNNLLGQYKKDSKEYKEAQREKWQYENNLKQKQDSASGSTGTTTTGGGRSETPAERLAKAERAYYQQVQKIVGTTTKEVLDSYSEQLKAAKDYFKELEKSSDFTPAVKSVLKDYNNVLDEQIKNYSNKSKQFKEITIAFLRGFSKSEIERTINDFPPDFSEMFNIDEGDIADKWRSIDWNGLIENGIVDIADLAQIRVNVEGERLAKQFNALLQDSIMYSSEEANRKINDQIIRLFQTSIKPTVADQLTDLQNEINRQTNDIDLQLATDSSLAFDNKAMMDKEQERAKMVYDNAVKQIQAQVDFYTKTVNYVEENDLLPSEQYQVALQKIQEFQNKLNQLKLTYLNESNEITKRYFDITVGEIQTEMDSAIKTIQDRFERENNTGSIWNMLTPVSGKEALKNITEVYDTQLDYLNKIRDKWNERLLDQNLTNEQRIEAEARVAEVTGQIQDAELEKEVAVGEQRMAIYQQWVDGVTEAVSQIGSLFGSLADYYEKDIELKVKNGEMTEKEADKSFENIKAMRVAEAVINTIAGSIGAFLQASATYPAPYGQIIGGITAAAVAAAGATQIANIKSQTRNSSSVNTGSVSAPQMAYDYNPTYTRTLTGEQDLDNLRNAVSGGMSDANIYVSVTDINEVQNKVRVTDNSTNF